MYQLSICHFRLKDINTSHQIHFSKMNWKISFRNLFSFLEIKQNNKKKTFEIESLLHHRAWGKAMNINLDSKDPENFEKKTEYTTVYVIRTQALASKVSQRVLRHCNPFSFIVASISTVKNTFAHLFCIDWIVCFLTKLWQLFCYLPTEMHT